MTRNVYGPTLVLAFAIGCAADDPIDEVGQSASHLVSAAEAQRAGRVVRVQLPQGRFDRTPPQFVSETAIESLAVETERTLNADSKAGAVQTPEVSVTVEHSGTR
jgi:hypothetical protein